MIIWHLLNHSQITPVGMRKDFIEFHLSSTIESKIDPIELKDWWKNWTGSKFGH